ncbi:Gfo/Idh/MocA family oxidoreductase [Fictibacillus nanhaiensis]|uniref:Gfo/Idh/MocA family protein n=1 Tax=Fictibacillus nanhaiensis TaxID=742169 RepID=UPI001C97A7E8|nr:Gfo/Idh/MocA family oxidoreductase [Fictibacillus nanhaiensis]MBY6036499.1 Gfo/Idh/MocA family oxidoreductase [Fictibacillus nanhaiensis]
MMLRVGIIGAGGIAQGRHIPAFQQLGDKAKVTAISDVNVEVAKTAALKFHVPNYFTSYVEMWPHVDAVVICTPNKFHREITIAALNAGKHVLCEKPMAMTVEECSEMVEAEKRSGKVLSIAYHYRHMKESQAAKRVIEAGEVGNPLVIRVQALRRRKVPGWGVFTNKELQGGGSLIDYGCHLLDLTLWLLGNPAVREVSGQTYNTLSREAEQVNQWGSFEAETFEVDDHVTAYMRLENGATVLFETSWAANIPDDAEMLRISGDRGGLDVFPFMVNKAENGMMTTTKADWISGEDDPGLPQARNFVDSCLGIAEPLVTAEEAMNTSRVIEAIYASSLMGKAILLQNEEGVKKV